MISAPYEPEQVLFQQIKSNSVLLKWNSPKPNRAKVDGFVINLFINDIEQPLIDLPNNPNETQGYTITNLRPGSFISAYVLAYADRKLYLDRKYTGPASKTAEITLLFFANDVLSFDVVPARVDSHSIDLNMSTDADLDQTYSHMVIAVKEGQIDSNNLWVQILNLSTDTREYQLSGLKPDSTYTVQIDGILRGELGRGILSRMTVRTLKEEGVPSNFLTCSFI